MGYAEDAVYRRPHWFRRQVNRAAAVLAGLGLTPKNTVRLEVRGRKTGRTRSFTVTTAEWRGDRYLVSLAGESDWVRNLRAAHGRAVIRHGSRRAVRTEEIPTDERAPVLSAYLGPPLETGSNGLIPKRVHRELERRVDRFRAFDPDVGDQAVQDGIAPGVGASSSRPSASMALMSASAAGVGV